MKCIQCNSENCSVINEVTTTGKDVDAGMSFCGYILMGPIGLLCGLCGEGKQTKNTQYWVCNNCGCKFRLDE